MQQEVVGLKITTIPLSVLLKIRSEHLSLKVISPLPMVVLQLIEHQALPMESISFPFCEYLQYRVVSLNDYLWSALYT